MAQPSRYQYVEVVGPVLVPTPLGDATSLCVVAWHPGHRLRRHDALHYVVPTDEPTVLPYDPAGLEWLPSDRYAGRALASTPRDLTVWPPPTIVIWNTPRDSYHGQPLPRAFGRDLSVLPPLYNPEGLEWQPRGQWPARGLTSSPVRDLSVLPPRELVYSPAGLEWVPRGQPPSRGVLGAPLRDLSILPPPQLGPYTPEGLEWLPRGQHQPRRTWPTPGPAQPSSDLAWNAPNLPAPPAGPPGSGFWLLRARRRIEDDD